MQEVLSKNRLKVFKSLRLKKGRLKERAFLVEGHKSVSEALHGGSDVLAVISAMGFDGLPKKADFLEADEETCNELSSLSTSPGILAAVRIPEWYLTSPPEDLLEKAETILYLDGIRDPGNLGTIIRTAAWFGNTTIVCSEDCVDVFNPKVVQATMGALFKQAVYTAPLNTLKGKREILGMDMQGESVFGLITSAIFVIGSESHGIREEALSQVNRSVSIPGGGRTESLNAALAAGILMAEQYRIRHQ